MDGYSGEINFLEAEKKCDVQTAYGAVDQAPGNYAVTIARKDDDWYEVWGAGLFIKTSACISLALGEKAVLSLVGAGIGTLHIKDMQCMVEGVYSRLQL
jgi:hypothetical protein